MVETSLAQTNNIYRIIDPRDGQVRYIGVSKVSIERRLKRHIKAASNGSTLPVHCWIRKMISLGLAPTVGLLEVTHDRERECFWIAEYRAQGAPLLNCTAGGDGLVNPTEETRRKMSLSHKDQRPTAKTILRAKERKGWRHTPEAIEKMCVPRSAAHRKSISEGVKAAYANGRARLTGDESPSRKHPERVLRGERHGNAKLTEEIVREIRRSYVPRKVSTTYLARKYGVSQATIWRILKCWMWKHVT